MLVIDIFNRNIYYMTIPIEKNTNLPPMYETFLRKYLSN